MNRNRLKDKEGHVFEQEDIEDFVDYEDYYNVYDYETEDGEPEELDFSY